MKLQKSIEMIIEDDALTQDLRKIYEQVASGQCKGCLKCCTESVNTFFVEYVHIFQFLKNNPQILAAHAAKISRFFLLEMMESMYCPFVDHSGKCAIYPVRPLPCRIFGHLEEEDYQENYEQVLESNKTLAKYYLEQYKLEIPLAIINRQIPYCIDFLSDHKMTADDRDDLVDLLFSLDSKFLMADCITFEDVNQSLVTWFIKSLMPIEDAGEMRIKAMNLYANQEEDELIVLINNLSEKIKMLNVV